MSLGGLILWVKKKRENRYMHIEMGKKEKMEREKREEWMLRNGGLLLEKRISYFNGKYSNPIRGFSAKELQKATDNYNPNLISGFVGHDYRWYKGCLEGRVIFVKNYNDYLYYADPEMVSNEIAVAAQVSGHKNALKLLGCCLETPKPTLVFEFPKKGILDYKLTSNPTSLPWRIRLKIANEIASVITYLHTKFPRPIIHRNIHPRHFHLDQDFSAKLSDFILCMALPEGKTQVDNELIIENNGYIAPELGLYGVYSEKSDVFGFGSLLLFLLTGMRDPGRMRKYFEYHSPSTTNETEAEAGIEIEEEAEVAGGGEGVHHHPFQGVSEFILRCHTMNEIVDHAILAEAEAGGGGEGVHHHPFQGVSEFILRCHTMNEIVDPTILAEAEVAGGGVHQHHHHQFQAVSELILRCHRRNAEERPFMLDVAKQLKRIQRY